jgi:D-methionine transport system permease protein
MSTLLKQLLENNVIQLGIWETVYMTILSTVIAYAIGLPVGIFLTVTDKDGILPIPWLNKVVGFIVNFLRSIPFIILMVAMLPVAKLVVGTSIGNKAMIVVLIIAAAPYIARIVESSAKEVDKGVLEAAKAMGANNFQIIFKVILPEAKPALIVGAVISTVTILGYSAMAGTIGGTGLGQIAITYGYQRYQDQIVWLCVFLMVIIVQIIQEFGMWLARALDKRNNDSGKNAPVSTVQQEYNQQ